MNCRRCCWLVLAVWLALCPTRAAAEPGPVVVVPLQGEVSEAQFFFLRRALKEAEREGASAFVIDMETFGGEVKAAIHNMDALLKTKVPTFTYINNKAISAGALIAIATQKIYMAPTGVIGAAAPVLGGGEDLSKTMNDKTVSTLSAMARAASQQNGHNADVADAFIIKEKEVKIGEVVIDKSDTLLTLSAHEAARVFDGKPLLAAGISASLEEMLRQGGLRGVVRRVQPTGFERLASWITSLAPLFLLGGIVGAYIEFKTPGFGLPGFASLVCFAIFFTGHFLAGLAGWEVVVLFGLGAVLVLGELLLHPGTVLPGVAGVILMLGALVWAMIDRYPSQPWWPSSEMLLRPMLNLSLAVIAGALAIYFLAKMLPRTSLYRRIVLARTSAEGPTATLPGSFSALAPGMSGIARTMLRPSGKAEVGGQLVDVVTQGDFIEPGADVRVIAVEGSRVVVALA